jgi:hypothetical protein
LDSNDGNVLKSIGEYNGWSEGMTYVRGFSACPTSFLTICIGKGDCCTEVQVLSLPEQSRLVCARGKDGLMIDLHRIQPSSVPKWLDAEY